MRRVVSLVLSAIIIFSCISNNSDLKYAYAADTTKPTAPTNLLASNVKETTFNLSWNASTDNVKVSKYLVYQGTKNIKSVTTTSCSVTGLTKNTSYNFYVVAVDSSNNKSANSTVLTVKTAIDSTVPITPASLTTASVGMTSLTLSWTKSTDTSGIAKYNIYENGVAKYTSTTNSIAITGLTMNTSYSYQVEAVDTYSNLSAKSIVKSVTTLNDTQVPTQPTGLTSSNINENSLDLSWTASTDNVAVANYLVYQNNTNIQTVTTPNCTVSGLTKDTSYDYYVVAVDTSGNKSTNSTVITAKTAIDSTAPSIPASLTATEIAMYGLTLSWENSTDLSGIASYEIY